MATLSADPPRARILAVAGEHVRAHGLRRLTVVGVAADAGMTHANVYRYFTSKTALVDALSAEWLRPLEDLLAGVADAPDPATDKLERIILALNRTYRQTLERDPHLYGAFVDAFVQSRGIARKHRARVRGLLERVIDEGISGGAFTLRDPSRALSLVLDATYRFIHPMAIQMDRDQGPLPEPRLERLLAAVSLALTGRRNR